MSVRRVALLSLRPRFADALLSGVKTVEVRRRRAHLESGSLCLIYASSPVCSVLGAVRVVAVETGSAETLWDGWGKHTFLERAEYDAYLDGSASPCAIVVEGATRFAAPAPLRELRRNVDSFVAPQSYRFLREVELDVALRTQLTELKSRV